MTHREIIARALYERSCARAILAPESRPRAWDDLPDRARRQWLKEADKFAADLAERGLCIVPVEPTEEMQRSATARPQPDSVSMYDGIYRAMIAAAPK